MEESIIMKKFAFVLALSLVVAGSALAVTPTLNVPGTGGHQQYNSTPRNTVVWSEPADLLGTIASSETITDFSLVTEIANDFVLTADNTICLARWWGGYYANDGLSYCTFPPFGVPWNLRFYGDAGCFPDDFNVVYELLSAPTSEVSIGCMSDLFPLFQYEATVSVPITANNLYWFGAQTTNHGFPPQAGRLSSVSVINCEACFKSAYFAFPNWTPSTDVFGAAYDFSQEFEADCGTPTNSTTWGAIKGLYR